MLCSGNKFNILTKSRSNIYNVQDYHLYSINYYLVMYKNNKGVQI